MNKVRRKEISKAMELVGQLKDTIQNVLDDEQDAYNNLAENLQEGENGQKMQAAIDALESAVSSAEEIESYLEEASQ